MNSHSLSHRKYFIIGAISLILLGIVILDVAIFRYTPLSKYDAAIVENLKAMQQTTLTGSDREKANMLLNKSSKRGSDSKDFPLLAAYSPLINDLTTVSQSIIWLSDDITEKPPETFVRMMIESESPMPFISDISKQLTLMVLRDAGLEHWEGVVKKMRLLLALSKSNYIVYDLKTQALSAFYRIAQILLIINTPSDILLEVQKDLMTADSGFIDEVNIFERIESNLRTRKSRETLNPEIPLGSASVQGAAKAALNSLVLANQKNPDLNLPDVVNRTGISFTLLNPPSLILRGFGQIPLSRGLAVSTALKRLATTHKPIMSDLDKAKPIIGTLPLGVQMFYLYTNQVDSPDTPISIDKRGNIFTPTWLDHLITNAAYTIAILEKTQDHRVNSMSEISEHLPSKVESAISLREPFKGPAYRSFLKETTVSLNNVSMGEELANMYLDQIKSVSLYQTDVTTTPIDANSVNVSAVLSISDPFKQEPYTYAPLLADGLRLIYQDEGASVTLWRGTASSTKWAEVPQSDWKSVAQQPTATYSPSGIGPRKFQVRLEMPMPATVRVLSPDPSGNLPTGNQKTPQYSMVLK